MKKIWFCLALLPLLAVEPAGSCNSTYVFGYESSQAQAYGLYIYCAAGTRICIAAGCNGPGTHCVDDGENSYCLDYQY